MKSSQILSQRDPILGAAIARVNEHLGALEEDTRAEENHFVALCHIVAGQQLSTHVARAIRNRLSAHFGADFSPVTVAKTEHETLRNLGLSGAKARTLHALAAHIQGGNLQISQLETLSDEEIAREIVAVKGLGPWSADMFLMFHTNRTDVLPVGDLGIRKAIQKLYELPALPTPDEMISIAEPWRPHRTLACRYLWRWLDLKIAD